MRTRSIISKAAGSACADPATHSALAHVFDDRLRVRALDGQWLALPTSGGERP